MWLQLLAVSRLKKTIVGNVRAIQDITYISWMRTDYILFNNISKRIKVDTTGQHTHHYACMISWFGEVLVATGSTSLRLTQQI